jgi:hypothetical protein
LAKSGITHGSDIQNVQVQVPIEIQGHLQQTIQTHAGVTIVPTSSSASAWFDTQGFDRIGATFINDASTNSSLSLQWSNDGVTVHGYEPLIVSATTKEKAGSTETKARYVKVNVWNNDTAAPHVMSAWIYLKA